MGTNDALSGVGTNDVRILFPIFVNFCMRRSRICFSELHIWIFGFKLESTSFKLIIRSNAEIVIFEMLIQRTGSPAKYQTRPDCRFIDRLEGEASQISIEKRFWLIESSIQRGNAFYLMATIRYWYRLNVCEGCVFTVAFIC